ncbi:MAG: hypothetical protein E6G94_15310 [Alphaproteobacteria bacterium]|nr:MAG: hypothetical protein E6G94_15310 [Alphaproteobacteria bacterium]
MPPRNPELPEGTDHIINGAMDSSGDSGGGAGIAGGGSGGGGGSSTGVGGGAAASGGTGFVGSGGSDDTGGTAAGGTGGGTANLVESLRDQGSALRGQATDRVREFAVGGKDRVTDALDELARVVTETAETIDERMGAEYGGYARRAAGAVSDFSGNLRGRDVDEIYDGARAAVRKSPGIAIAAAAVLGFAIARLVKSGLNDTSGGGGTGSGGTGSGTGA